MSYLPRLHEPINRFGSPGVLSTVVEFKGERQCSISVEHSSMTPACRDCRVRVFRDAYHAAREGLGDHPFFAPSDRTTFGYCVGRKAAFIGPRARVLFRTWCTSVPY